MPISDPHRAYFTPILLELELRRRSGVAFQDFFASAMSAAHGDGYVKVRPWGRKGDKGCDGYLRDNGRVYQCYGALNAGSWRANYLASKMKEDFALAKSNLASIMKGWAMVHNLVDGLPVEAVQALDDLARANPEIEFSFFGPESFRQMVDGLPGEKIDQLLGPIPGTHQVNNLQPTELRDMLARLAERASTDAVWTPLKPVPHEKLVFNQVPPAWASLLVSGYQNTRLVEEYLRAHPDPLLGERIAQWFNTKYLLLRAQKLPAGAILSHLLELATDHGQVPAERQVVGQAVIAYLFERCDIFEDHPQPASPVTS